MVIHVSTFPARIALLLLVLCLSLGTQAASIGTSVDRNPVHLGESFTLSFTASGSVDGDPDFSPLEKLFRIMGRNRSSKFSDINGKLQRSTTWSLTLEPRKTGTFTIPAIAFGKDHSSPTVITVLAAPAPTDTDTDQDVILEAEISDAAPYVQAQTTLTIRLLHAVGISNARLSKPAVSNGDAVIERLGDDRSYTTRRGRRRYQVIERRYALFPQQSGALTVEPLRLEASKTRPARSGSLFDDLFQRQMGPNLHLATKPIELTVKAIPPSYPSGQWLPAQGMELSQQWSTNPPRFRVGEPVTRTLNLSVLGQTSAQLPTLGSAPGPDWKVYPDQPELKQQASGDLIVSNRIEKLALIPTHAGKLTLPGATIHWWNTRTDKLETARIAPREVQVLPATQAAPTARSQTRQPVAAPRATVSAAPHQAAIPLWIWLLLALLAIGWAGTAAAWWLSRRRDPRPRRAPATSARQAEKRLQLACRQQDPRAARDALLAWADSRWPQRRHTSLGQLMSGVPPELRKEITQLEQAIYAPDNGNWQGQPLWQVFQTARDALDQAPEETGQVNGLEPLFRQVGTSH